MININMKKIISRFEEGKSEEEKVLNSIKLDLDKEYIVKLIEYPISDRLIFKNCSIRFLEITDKEKLQRIVFLRYAWGIKNIFLYYFISELTGGYNILCDINKDKISYKELLFEEYFSDEFREFVGGLACKLKRFLEPNSINFIMSLGE